MRKFRTNLKPTKMKKIIQTVFLLVVPLFLSAQSVSPDVISSSGDYFEGSNASLSWTLGEIATETLSNGSVTLTQGFQQPISVVIHGIDLDMLVYLEGPYQEGSMVTHLKDSDLLPTSQPYSGVPWNCPGSEIVDPIPANVVDWVCVELRDAASAETADGSTWVEKQAAFILNDGSVVGLDGVSVLQFTANIYKNPYIVVWHRNHIGILSANALTEEGGTYSYDFSTSITQAHGGAAGYKIIDTGSGLYGMAGGDANNDGSIGAADKSLWSGDAGTTGYKSSDFNLDTQVSNPDKNDIWQKNSTVSSQIPE